MNTSGASSITSSSAASVVADDAAREAKLLLATSERVLDSAPLAQVDNRVATSGNAHNSSAGSSASRGVQELSSRFYDDAKSVLDHIASLEQKLSTIKVAATRQIADNALPAGKTTCASHSPFGDSRLLTRDNNAAGSASTASQPVPASRGAAPAAPPPQPTVASATDATLRLHSDSIIEGGSSSGLDSPPMPTARLPLPANLGGRYEPAAELEPCRATTRRHGAPLLATMERAARTKRSVTRGLATDAFAAAQRNRAMRTLATSAASKSRAASALPIGAAVNGVEAWISRRKLSPSTAQPACATSRSRGVRQRPPPPAASAAPVLTPLSRAPTTTLHKLPTTRSAVAGVNGLHVRLSTNSHQAHPLKTESKHRALSIDRQRSASPLNNNPDGSRNSATDGKGADGSARRASIGPTNRAAAKLRALSTHVKQLRSAQSQAAELQHRQQQCLAHVSEALVQLQREVAVASKHADPFRTMSHHENAAGAVNALGMRGGLVYARD